MNLDNALKKFLIREPFYGFFLTNFNKKLTTKVPTAGVWIRDCNYELLVNPNFWETLTDEQQIAVLKHETMHIAYQHCLLYKDLKDHQLANMAMDAEINLHIKNLPEGAIDCRTWARQDPSFKIENGTRYNYDWLMKQAEKSDSDMSSLGNLIDDHSGLESSENLSDAEKTILKASAESGLKAAYEAGKLAGNIPGEMSSILNEILIPKIPVFDWKSYFRRLLGTSVITLPKHTRKRPSKRFDEAAGRKHIHKSHLLIAIDTSGSISTRELKEFYGELTFIHKSGVITMDVAQFDYDVYTPKPFSNSLPEICGRGGTSFSAPIEYFNNHREYDYIVIFTDGYAEPVGARMNKVIWVITKNGNQLATDFPGKTVFIK